MNKILIAGMLLFVFRMDASEPIANKSIGGMYLSGAKVAKINQGFKGTRQSVEYQLLEEPIELVFVGFGNKFKALPIQMPVGYERKEKQTEDVACRLKFAIEQKLIPDEIDCEDVLMCDGYLYGLRKCDKPLLMLHPRERGEATEVWLKRVSAIKKEANRPAPFPDEEMDDSSDDFKSIDSNYSEYSEVEPLLPFRGDAVASSVEVSESSDTTDTDSVASLNQQDNLPELSLDDEILETYVPRSKSKKSAKAQLETYKETFNKKEQSSSISSGMKWGIGVSALAAYAYFCYSKSKVVRTNK